jgi:hypothetical protein
MHGARICRTKRRAVDPAQPGDRGTTAELWLPVANISAQAVAPAEPRPGKIAATPYYCGAIREVSCASKCYDIYVGDKL